jgi:hypothetical protein
MAQPSAPHARAWLGPRDTPLHNLALVTWLLQSIFVEPWRVSGVGCPYRGCQGNASPSCVHALGCGNQHHRGLHATHSAMKRCWQHLLRSHHVLGVRNEDSSMFTLAVGQKRIQVDTAVDPGGMALCASKDLRHKGIIYDNSIRCPTAAKYLEGRVNAATTAGVAAATGEHDKLKHHMGRFNERSWHFVPFIQETFGRMGERAAAAVRELAFHSAQCSGGSQEEIARRRAHTVVHIRSDLSVSLARELAERVFAYIRGAILKGRTVHPVSALLDFAGA